MVFYYIKIEITHTHAQMSRRIVLYPSRWQDKSISHIICRQICKEIPLLSVKPQLNLIFFSKYPGSLDSLVSIVTRLRAGRLWLFDSWQKQGYFLFAIASRPSYPVDTESSLPGGKAAGREADHSPLSSAEVKNAWSYTSTSQYFFVAW
jgi:hypothetical protein